MLVSRYPLALLLAAATLAGCASAPPAMTSDAEARAVLSEAERATRRAEADSMSAPYLADAMRDVDAANAALASGDTDQAAHLAYLARQRVRIAEYQAEVDEAERAIGETEGGTRILVTDAFRSGQTALRPESARAIDSVASYLTMHSARVVLVESFTDATGNPDRNLDLSRRRADAVRMRLIEAGIDSSRVEAIGFGQAYPVASNETGDGQRQNRRIEIVVGARLDALPRRDPPPAATTPED